MRFPAFVCSALRHNHLSLSFAVSLCVAAIRLTANQLKMPDREATTDFFPRSRFKIDNKRGELSNNDIKSRQITKERERERRSRGTLLAFLSASEAQKIVATR
jgi:hypothetical protein